MKIRLVNADRGRNKQAFHLFLTWAKLFRELDIEFSTSNYGKFDYVFIGPEDFIYKKDTLENSVTKGIEFIKQFRGNKIFLFDTSDSTSLTGAYEVLDLVDDTVFLYKNQLLDFSQYETPAPFNKWFWAGDEFNKSYNIPIRNKQRIKLTGWNLGHIHPEYHIFDYDEVTRANDICAVYQHTHDENYDFGFRNDLHYTNHRLKPIELLQNSNIATKYKYELGKRERDDYYRLLKTSKIAISPFGMGEICYRDFELMIFNTPMLKPDMSKVITEPDIYIPWETYIPVKYDWSDLENVLDKFFNNYESYSKVAQNFRDKFRRKYLLSNLATKWFKILNE